jgi:DNA-binding NarL/FixJ family response regulator
MPRPLWALVEDLFFRAKVEGLCAPLGRPVSFHRDAASLVAALREAREAAAAPPAAIVVELGGRADQGMALLALLRELPDPPPTLAFYSHVEDELRRRALELGATAVVPRSAFVKKFGALVGALSESPAG